jgi:hypothetical protein
MIENECERPSRFVPMNALSDQPLGTTWDLRQNVVTRRGCLGEGLAPHRCRIRPGSDHSGEHSAVFNCSMPDLGWGDRKAVRRLVIVIIIVAAGSKVGHDAASLQAFTNLSLAGAAIAAVIVNGPAQSRGVAPANGPASSRSDSPIQSRRVTAANGRASSRFASLVRAAIVGSAEPPQAAAGGMR